MDANDEAFAYQRRFLRKSSGNRYRGRSVSAMLALVFRCGGALPVLGETPVQDGFVALQVGKYSEAYEIFLPHGESGNVDAQYNFSVKYEEGLGVPQDFEAALRWMKLAAAHGDSNAQVRLGVLFENGLGTEADPEDAVKWYRLSAEQGNVHGQSNLADQYLTQ